MLRSIYALTTLALVNLTALAALAQHATPSSPPLRLELLFAATNPQSTLQDATMTQAPSADITPGATLSAEDLVKLINQAPTAHKQASLFQKSELTAFIMNENDEILSSIPLATCDKLNLHHAPTANLTPVAQCDLVQYQFRAGLGGIDILGGDELIAKYPMQPGAYVINGQVEVISK